MKRASIVPPLAHGTAIEKAAVDGCGTTVASAPGSVVVTPVPPRSGTPAPSSVGVEPAVGLVVVVVGMFARWSLVGGRIDLPSPVSQAANVTRALAATATRRVDGRRNTPGEAR